MVTNNKDRRRRDINQKRLIFSWPFLSGMVLCFFLTFLFLSYIDRGLNHILEGYIDSEVDRIVSIVVHQALIRSMDDHLPSYIIIERGIDNSIQNISYNMVEIDRFKNRLSELVQEEFYYIEKGDFRNYSLSYQEKLRNKYPYFKNGYLCEVSFNSLRNSVLFGNVGPVIPIKLSFMGFVYSDVVVQIKEYGVNNVFVEVDVEVTVSNLITMPISSRTHDVVVKEVLSMEMIKGEIPNYFVGSMR